MKHLALALSLTLPLLWSCDSQPTQPSEAGVDAGKANTSSNASLAEQPNLSLDFDPDNFVRVVDNPLFPLRPGTRFVYQGEEDGEAETNVVIVTYDRKTILGVSAIVVLDRVFVDGELKEKTFDWYAQDKQGNVWYLGENSKEYEDGKVVSTEGSWMAGRDGAKAGIIMLAHPRLGDSYYQEFYVGEAEDQARVTARGVHVTVPYGSFDNCLKTLEHTRLEPGVSEAKLFCPGVGFVRAHSKEGPLSRLVLTRITRVPR
jgi:hypothetical protein